MARKTIEEHNVRRLTRTGNGKSISVTLPIDLVRELGWRDKQKVFIRKRGETLIVENWKKIKS